MFSGVSPLARVSEPQPHGRSGTRTNPAGTSYLSCLFAPSGLYLLWQFTGWETMYVFTGQGDLPAWLVVLFAITNVTQGILGYWLASRYIRKGKLYPANLLWIAGYFLMFFILVHGWDGTGYRRFFTRTVAEWQAQPQTPGLTQALQWAVCPVALTLYTMGVIMLPLLFYWIAKWSKDGYELDGKARAKGEGVSKLKIVFTVLRLVFIHTLGSAILSSILIHNLGWILGLLVFFSVAWAVWLRKGGLLRREISIMTLQQE
jgi:hypothetical protein